MEYQHLVVYVTCPDESAARELADDLVQSHLAACVNAIPGVQSTYLWEGHVERDGEVLLVVKTTAAGFAALERRVRARHPYDTPEIIALPLVAGSAEYLAWIEQSVGEVGDGG